MKKPLRNDSHMRMKGPILASVFAVSDLVKEGLLDVDVVFLVEGEEESGSIGFASAAEQHKVMITETQHYDNSRY
jgi:di- and tripeptidase